MNWSEASANGRRWSAAVAVACGLPAALDECDGDTVFRMMESCGFVTLTVPLVDPLTKAWQEEMVLY